jgi:hypothetical protein
MVCDDGTSLKLSFNGEHNLPLSKRIALSVSDYPQDDGSYSVDVTKKYFTPVTETIAGARVAPTKKHIALFRQLPENYNDELTEKEMKKAHEMAKGLEDFWRYYARHMWDIEVRAYPLKSACDSLSPEFCKTAINQYIKETGLDGFDANYFHVLSSKSMKGWCGHADLGGFYGATYEGAACNLKSTIHEIGHNFGLHHANEATRADDNQEYGDETSVMGGDSIICGLNSLNMLQLEFDTDREIKVVNQSQQLLMCPIELSQHVLHDNEHQHVIVQVPGAEDHFLSLRKDKGFPYRIKGGKGSTIYIHKITSGAQKKSLLLKRVSPGESTGIGNGPTLEYLEYNNETARINILFNKSDKVEELEIPTDFPEKLKSVELSEKHNGLWYNKDFLGQGFDVQVKNGKMTIIWYTFNEKDSSRRFYIGSCDVTDGTEKFELFTTKDGTFEDPKSAVLVPAGKGQLYFFNDKSGVFNFETPEHGRGSIEVEALALSENTMNGLWYNPARDREGFSVQFFSHLNSCTAYWYTYGPGGRYTKNDTQRWFMCQGEKVNDAEYDLTIYEIRNGLWLFFNEIDVVNVGKGKLRIKDNNNIDIDYDINVDQHISGKDTLNLIRLF